MAPIVNEMAVYIASVKNIQTNEVKRRRRSNVVAKFKKVSDTVWVSFEAMRMQRRH